MEAQPTLGVQLPDLTGLTADGAVKELKKIGLTAVVEGEGTLVFSQLPAAGQTVAIGTEVLVYVKKEFYYEAE